MTTPDKETWLRELDGLDFRERMRQAAFIGRGGAGSPALESLLHELEAGDVYEHRLALAICRTSGEGGVVLRALESPSLAVRRHAARLAPRLITEDGLLAAATLAASPGLRAQLLRGIVRARRRELAERLLPEMLEEYGPGPAAVLLVGCGPDVVRRWLPVLSHAVRGWRRLAGRCPDAVLEFVRLELQSAGSRERARLWSSLLPAVEGVSLTRAREVAQLALEFGAAENLDSPGSPLLGRLVRRAPDLIAKLLLRTGDRLLLGERNLGSLRRRSRASSLADIYFGWGLPKPIARNARAFSLADRLALAAVMGKSPASLAEFLEGTGIDRTGACGSASREALARAPADPRRPSAEATGRGRVGDRAAGGLWALSSEAAEWARRVSGR